MILSFINQKGGTAKTTSCLNIGAALARKGKSVLLIDLDPQGSLTKAAGVHVTKDDKTLYEVLKGEIGGDDLALDDVTKDAKGYYIVPTDIRMSGAEIELVGTAGRDFLLKNAIDDMQQAYDYILIDCSPALNIFTLMALTASDSLIIPVSAQYMALDGMAQLLSTIKQVQKRTNRGLAIYGVLVTMYDNRRIMDKEIVENIKKYFPDKIFKTFIKINTKLAEAPARGEDIYKYDPKSTGADCYTKVTEEILERNPTK